MQFEKVETSSGGTASRRDELGLEVVHLGMRQLLGYRRVLTGFGVNGAQAEYYVALASGTVVLPDGLSYEAAAPIMCSNAALVDHMTGLRIHPQRPSVPPRDLVQKADQLCP